MDGYYTTSEYSPVQAKKADASAMMPQMPQMPQPSMAQPMAQPMPSNMGQMGNAMMAQNPYQYDSNIFSLDSKEFFKRAVKYIFEGLCVALFAYYFTKNKLDLKEVIMLGLIAAATFAVLDFASPTISLGMRFGTGWGLSQGLLSPAMMGAAPVAMMV
jgi:hypothetical protein